jgi:hypothetical protein
MGRLSIAEILGRSKLERSGAAGRGCRPHGQNARMELPRLYTGQLYSKIRRKIPGAVAEMGFMFSFAPSSGPNSL